MMKSADVIYRVEMQDRTELLTKHHLAIIQKKQ